MCKGCSDQVLHPATDRDQFSDKIMAAALVADALYEVAFSIDRLGVNGATSMGGMELIAKALNAICDEISVTR